MALCCAPARKQMPKIACATMKQPSGCSHSEHGRGGLLALCQPASLPRQPDGKFVSHHASVSGMSNLKAVYSRCRRGSIRNVIILYMWLRCRCRLLAPDSKRLLPSPRLLIYIPSVWCRWRLRLYSLWRLQRLRTELRIHVLLVAPIWLSTTWQFARCIIYGMTRGLGHGLAQQLRFVIWLLSGLLVCIASGTYELLRPMWRGRRHLDRLKGCFFIFSPVMPLLSNKKD